MQYFRCSSQVQVAHYQTPLITERFVTVCYQIKIINHNTNVIAYFAMSSLLSVQSICTHRPVFSGWHYSTVPGAPRL